MNTSKTLFTTLNALIFVIVLAILIGLLLAILSISGVFPESMIENEVPYTELESVHYLFMALNLIVYFIFIIGLFKLRTVAKLFLNNNIYNSKLGVNSNNAGKYFMFSGVFWWLFDGLSTIHFNNEFSIGVSDKTFIYLFIIVMGLFLMLTSKLFDKALELKNENDLTI